MKAIIYLVLSPFLFIGLSAASTTQWEQMQYPEWEEVKLDALSQAGLSADAERLIVESCKRELEKSQSYYLRYGGSAAHLKEISKQNQIRQACSGKVGDTWCQQDAMLNFMNQCASSGRTHLWDATRPISVSVPFQRKSD